MTTHSTDQYIAECRRIHERLREIAWRTDRMAREHCARYDNPNFARAFTEQTELLQRLSDLDAQILVLTH
ncbi:MAG TPA: hypothetical protein VK670_02705 [Silvibacterium sp.]|nr:hypothetical protein [Silvibacterium sp.]